MTSYFHVNLSVIPDQNFVFLAFVTQATHMHHNLLDLATLTMAGED
jgi:hypothetical protein